MPTEYSATVFPTPGRPFLLTHKATGERYAVSRAAMDVYRRRLGARLFKVYTVEELKA
jgi:hypothetical protein